MTLEQLRIFVAVAERLHMTQAARALNLAQSAVSHAVASLEARHDTRLFHRIGRRIELTEAGNAFLHDARAVLSRVDVAEATLTEFGTLRRGELLVQASQTIAGYWLPRHLAAFHRLYPDIAIGVAIGNTAQVAEAVEAGRAELGFVEGAVDAAHLAAAPVARDQMVIVAAPGLAIPGGARPSPRDLLAVDWVLRERGSGTRSVFEDDLRKLGLEPEQLRVVLELPSNEAVRSAVEAGLGATALSASVAAPSLEAGLLQEVALRLPDRAFHVLHHKQRHLGRAASTFLAMIGRSSLPQ